MPFKDPLKRKEYERAYRPEYLKRMREEGRCWKCGSALDSEFDICTKCHEKKLVCLRNRGQIRKLERLQQGLCYRCGKNPIAPTSSRKCSDCLKKSSEYQLVNQKRNREHIIEYRRKRYETWRVKALEKIAEFHNHPLTCFSCGCDDISALDINHLNGRATETKSGAEFPKEIAQGKRNLAEYDIRCKVCNWIYFYEAKFGHHWQITYQD